MALEEEDAVILDDVVVVGGILCDLEFIRSRASNEDDLPGEPNIVWRDGWGWSSTLALGGLEDDSNEDIQREVREPVGYEATGEGGVEEDAAARSIDGECSEDS